MNCSHPGSSVHGILLARPLEQVAIAISSSRGSSPSRDQTHISCISCMGSTFFTCWAPRVGFPKGSSGKESAYNAGDTGDEGSIPGLRRSLGGGNGSLLQDSCLENSMDKGAWWAAVHGVSKCWTQLSIHIHYALGIFTHIMSLPTTLWDTCHCSHLMMMLEFFKLHTLPENWKLVVPKIGFILGFSISKHFTNGERIRN